MHRAVPALMPSLLLIGCATVAVAPLPTTSQLTQSPSPSEAQAAVHVTPSPVPRIAPQGNIISAQVVSIVDGDTITVEIHGSVVPLRYIGIDSPETQSPTGPVQWMGPEASAANQYLVEGETVSLERDVSETDRFDRLLRYVWIERRGQWLMVNRELVRLGFAVSKAYPPDTRYQSLLDAAQQEARAAQAGLWAATSAPQAKCDPSYPSACIPPPPPYLGCGDITFRHFTVLAPDPHGFDGNHDGIGCQIS